MIARMVKAGLVMLALTAPAAAEETLEGAPWRFVEVAAAPVDADRGAELVFGPDGSAGGSGGCNRFGGAYTVSGDSLSFGDLVGTQMFCEGAMELERAVFDALGATAAFAVADGRLELRDADGAVLAVLERE